MTKFILESLLGSSDIFFKTASYACICAWICVYVLGFVCVNMRVRMCVYMCLCACVCAHACIKQIKMEGVKQKRLKKYKPEKQKVVP